MMAALRKITLSGFKSIENLELELRPVNLLIGANGAGKSNLVSFFTMLNEMRGGHLQAFIGREGGAHSLLHYGPKNTPHLEASLDFEMPEGNTTYFVQLEFAAVDRLVFLKETIESEKAGLSSHFERFGGHPEAMLVWEDGYKDGDPSIAEFRELLDSCRVFHFHDTSSTAPIRQLCYIGHDGWLMPDAGNLAAMLNRFLVAEPTAYSVILAIIRQIAPFFDDFYLAPSSDDRKQVVLRWKERGSDMIFGPHQLSDGTLRAMALVTLLCQPKENLPALMVIDEPELGLHPQALAILASLIQKASTHCQILVATQSAALLDHFQPEDIVVVNRTGRSSTFERLPEEKLAEWLEEYSIGELWEKNVLGGKPAPWLG